MLFDPSEHCPKPAFFSTKDSIMTSFTSNLYLYSCILILIPFLSSAQLYKKYSHAQQWSAAAEVGGLSPILSINAEYIPLESQKGFLVLRGGVGHSFGRSVLCSLPHSLSWNLLLNGKTEGCPPVRPGNSTFIEVGIGGVYPLYTTKEIEANYRWSPLLGVRHYFLYNVRTTGFWKAQFTPLVTSQLSPWFGLSMGVVID